jgi:hypothetical protein
MHLHLQPIHILSLPLLLTSATAKYYLYLVNCTGNPQNQPWVGQAYYDLPSPPTNMEHPYDISIAVIGAAAAASWSWEGRGDGAIMGSWRLDFHIDMNASRLQRGEVAGGGTKHGDAGKLGDSYSECNNFGVLRED